MLKIVVFDSGWGGELVANYLESELNVVEVVRLIDWHNAPYSGRSRDEICRLTEQNIVPYIGKVDAIILGGYATSLALDDLQQKYPEQQFIGMGISYERILKSRSYPDKIAVLMDRLTSESELCAELRQNLTYSTIIIPDCTGWEEQINDNAMSQDVLRAELSWDFVLQPKQRYPRRSRQTSLTSKSSTSSGASSSTLLAAIRRFERAATDAACDEKDIASTMLVAANLDETRAKINVDAVLLLNTHFWALKPDLEALFGWQVRVLDFREKLLRDVCSALHLRGVDGKRPK